MDKAGTNVILAEVGSNVVADTDTAQGQESAIHTLPSQALEQKDC
jgi:hypothetical protein